MRGGGTVSETLTAMLDKYSAMLHAAKHGVLYTYSDTQIAIAAIAIVAQLMNERDGNAGKVAMDNGTATECVEVTP